MSKRFTDIEKWTKNKWFRKLGRDNKLFWLYLLDQCNNIGVWEEDIELAEMLLDIPYSIESLKKVFGDRIKIIDNGKKWWIKDFINFQYGVLDETRITNKPHQSYIRLLKSHRLWIDYKKTIHSVKEKDKDKEKDKEKDKDKEKSKAESSNFVCDNPPTETEIYLYMLGYVKDKEFDISPDRIKKIQLAFYNHYGSEDCNWTYMAGGTKRTKLKDWTAKARKFILDEKEKK